ncbi:hypothetical protein [Egbenema bharatensis]|uniref:hypothetical protein n=1 Tax=Egbenema bharatensis TaxID=3463334 RepID=UPI003A83C34D
MTMQATQQTQAVPRSQELHPMKPVPMPSPSADAAGVILSIALTMDWSMPGTSTDMSQDADLLMPRLLLSCTDDE